MPSSVTSFSEKIDKLIRVFFYILAFWLPYSSAVVESCVIISVALWIIKRIVIHWPLMRKDKRYLLKAFKPPESVLNRFIYCFLLICLISVAFSSLWQRSLADFITKFMEWFAIFWLIQEVFTNRKQIFLLLGILTFTAWATALDAIGQYHFLGKDIFNGHPVTEDGRATASFNAPASLGAFMLTMIPLSLSVLFIGIAKSVRWAAFVMSGVMVWALMITFTRGAWAGGIAGILFFFIVYFLWKKNFEMKASLLVLLFLFLTVFFPLSFNAQSTLNLLKRSNTITWRLEVWADSWKMIKDRPLVGHGVNMYAPVFQSYRRIPKYAPTYAHNCFVQLAAEVGLLGLAAFMGLLVKFFQDSFRSLRERYNEQKTLEVISLGTLAGVFAFLVHSSVDTNFYSLRLSVLFWLLAGVQIKINRLVLQKSK